MNIIQTQTLLIDERDDRVVVALNRPEVKNAMNHEMIDELHEVCARLELEPKVLILTGGDGIFAGGADIREMVDRRKAQALQGINNKLFERLNALPLPTIAAIDGPAVGGGAEIAYACDFRIGTPRVFFANPEASLGILAAAGACWRLQELIGLPLAKEVVLAGRRISAQEALELHLVSQLVESEELMNSAHALADRILKNDVWALRMAKIVMAAPAGSHPTFDNVAQAILFESEGKFERMNAFIDRSNKK
jgi:enoyl-CoA hydratase